MALEDTLTKLIASLDANTAALKAAKGAGAASTTAPATITATKKDKVPAGPDFDAVKAAATKVMDKHGKPFAKKMIQDVGGAKELAAVKPEKYGALFKAFEAAMVETADEPDEAAEEDEL